MFLYTGNYVHILINCVFILNSSCFFLFRYGIYNSSCTMILCEQYILCKPFSKLKDFCNIVRFVK